MAIIRNNRILMASLSMLLLGFLLGVLYAGGHFGARTVLFALAFIGVIDIGVYVRSEYLTSLSVKERPLFTMRVVIDKTMDTDYATIFTETEENAITILAHMWGQKGFGEGMTHEKYVRVELLPLDTDTEEEDMITRLHMNLVRLHLPNFRRVISYKVGDWRVVGQDELRKMIETLHYED